MKIKKFLYILTFAGFLMFQGYNTAGAFSGESVGEIYETGSSFNASSITTDTENNIYILSQDTGGYRIKIYKAFVNPVSQSGVIINNISSSGSVETGTGFNINGWIKEFTSSDIFGFTNYIIGLIFFYFCILSALYFGLLYGYRFFKGK